MAKVNIDKILKLVEKPGRYTGGEYNSTMKEIDSVDIRFAFCFPDIYEIGMSHLGLRILYHVLNLREDTFCERVFAPWLDMEEQMRKNDIPLFTIETKSEISKFDFVGFTLQYEMSYTNIINMLNLANIPIKSCNRGEKAPFVIGGGPCAVNCEPIADFFDIFLIGESEESINELMDLYSAWKKRGGTRKEFLLEATKIKSAYVPSLYTVIYKEDGTIKEFGTSIKKVPKKIEKRIIDDLSTVAYPTEYIVPNIDIVFSRGMIELFRGCIRGCRFCQAGFIYRPVREKSKDVLVKQAKEILENTGYDELSLASLSTSDYSELPELTDELLEITEKHNVSLALPSLRIDNFSLELMQKVQKVRKSGLTFAPEAGTQRLRDVINKNINEEDIFSSLKLAFEGGWSNVKLYFMIGLPTETKEDIEGISVLANQILNVYFDIPKEKRIGNTKITVSTACFVPKPFTPFQWEPQATLQELSDKVFTLRTLIKNRKISYNWHEPKLSYLEGVFARGDRRLADVLVSAWKKGCKFDSWNECFKYDKWIDALGENNLDPNFYTSRVRNVDEILPWDHIDCGVSKKFLIKEKEKAYAGETTPDCKTLCSDCGILKYGGDICVQAKNKV